jgi:hypothetical protein
MRIPRSWMLAIAVGFQALSITRASALFLGDMGVRGGGGLRSTPVVVFGNNGRRRAEDYAITHKVELEVLKRDHAASGLIQCGHAHGAGQLTLSSDVVTTAAHVFFDEQGARRAKSCDFIVEIDGKEKRVPVDMKSIVAGAVRPYAAKPLNDWAVAKLRHPLQEISPYTLAVDLALNDMVEFVARGHTNWVDKSLMSFEECRLRAQTNQIEDGPREFAFDCETGDGASGGAVLLGDDRRQLGAILVGWRSDDPTTTRPFSSRNYNFVVSIEGAFRRALSDAAKTRTVDRGAPLSTTPPATQPRRVGRLTESEKTTQHRSLEASRQVVTPAVAGAAR